MPSILSPPSTNLALVEDLGNPSSYLSCDRGLAVYTCDGEEVGKVEHVLADPGSDIFDGIVLDTSALPGGNRFVDSEQVEEIFDRGVLLKIDRAAAEKLPVPSANPATMEVSADDVAEGDEDKLKRRLKRAWDVLSGND
jgi:PRC-barrel domain